MYTSLENKSLNIRNNDVVIRAVPHQFLHFFLPRIIEFQSNVSKVPVSSRFKLNSSQYFHFPCVSCNYMSNNFKVFSNAQIVSKTPVLCIFMKNNNIMSSDM